MRSAAWGVAAVLLLALSGISQKAAAQPPQCAKTDFEAVVNEAGAALRDLNRENTPQIPRQAARTQGQARLGQRSVPERGGTVRA